MGIQPWVLAAMMVAAPARPAPAPRAEGEVVAVSLVSAPGRAELIITTRGAVSVRDFTLTDPHRIVFDVTGATLSTAAEPIYDGVARAGIVNVRVRQYSRDIVRVVLELDRPRPYQVERVDEGVHVFFGADETFLAWSTGVPAVALARAAPAAPEAPAASSSYPESMASRANTNRVPQQRAEPRISASWDGAAIADVVSGFSALSGRTIVLGKGVTGTVTAEIRDKPWSQAFQAILAAQGLSAQEMAGGI
ncbi:MAG: AMIN domain-containing protein, partial [Gemmatimonadota bacterium]